MRRLIAVAVILGGSTCLLFPEIFTKPADFGRKIIEEIGDFLTVVPLFVYAVVFLVVRSFAWKATEKTLLIPMDKQEAASLTLAGLCTTSLSLLISFFKEEIKRSEVAPQKILLFFTVALGCFIASYISLRYRIKNIFPLAAEAFLDNGLWCILAGLWTFTNQQPGLEALPRVLTVFIFVYFVHLGLNSYFYIKYARGGDVSIVEPEPAAPKPLGK
jgi:drug/metabolite transporter (DMT)-like permease